MDKPDKVMLEFQRGQSELDDYHGILAHDPIECHPRVYGDWEGQYLASTPEREAASELVEALRMYADEANWKDCGFVQGRKKSGDEWVNTLEMKASTIEKDRGGAARAILAKLESKK